MPRGKPYQRSEDVARVVEVMTACGDPVSSITLATGLAKETLRKYYGAEMDRGKESCHAQVKATLFKMATSGECPAATFFWLKTQCGFRETNNVDVTSGGHPLKVLTGATEDDVARALGLSSGD